MGQVSLSSYRVRTFSSDSCGVIVWQVKHLGRVDCGWGFLFWEICTDCIQV